MVVVATSGFGAGIDKANIHIVYHLGMPESLLEYAQQSGRAGKSKTEVPLADFTVFFELEHFKNRVEFMLKNAEVQHYATKKLDLQKV